MSRKIFFSALALYALIVPSLSADEPFTIPRSNKVIYGQLSFPDGTKINFVTRDGTWVTVEDRTSHYYYGFLGVIENGKPNFLAYEITRIADNTNAREISSANDVPVGTSRRYPQAQNIRLSTKGVGEWSFALAPIEDPSQYSALELQTMFGVSGNGICCVSCGPRTVCANSVEASCGSCDGGGGGAFVY